MGSLLRYGPSVGQPLSKLRRNSHRPDTSVTPN